MKQFTFILLAVILFTSCHTSSKFATAGSDSLTELNTDTLITQSLFNDKAATITEDGIQKVLGGNYGLPDKLRVAMVRIDQQSRSYYWNDEDFLKTQQSYLDLFEEKFKQSARVTNVSIIPNLLISKTPSFTSIREAAVRMQADVVVIYSIASDLYSKYKFFNKPDIKAFATTQLIMLDVRTGLIPFSTIITKDVLSQKKKEELDNQEARNRIQNEAVLLTIDEIGKKVALFLNTR
jgi:hypothetical protein